MTQKYCCRPADFNRCFKGGKFIKVVTPYQKEQCLCYIKEKFSNISHAKACSILNCSRRKKYYQKLMPQKDAVIKDVIEGSLTSTRSGRQKVIVKVQRKHPDLGAYRIRRVYEKEGFRLFKRMKNKRLNKPPNPIQLPLEKNVEWAMDFMSDALSNGRRIRTLNIVEQYNS